MFQILCVWHFCRKTIFIMRFLRIHPVQNVINNPTQLSGRGFPRIFYMELVLSQLYVFLVLQNGSRAVKFENLQIEMLKFWNFEFYNFRNVDFECLICVLLFVWNSEFWNVGFWNFEISKFWNFKIVQVWNVNI